MKVASAGMKMAGPMMGGMMGGGGGGDAGGGGGGDAGGGGAGAAGAPGGSGGPGGGGTATGAPSINKITVLVGNTGADVADGHPIATNNTQDAGGGGGGGGGGGDDDGGGGSGGKGPCWCANDPNDTKNRKHLRTCGRSNLKCKRFSRAAGGRGGRGGGRGGAGGRGKSKYSEEYLGYGVQMQPYLEKSDFPLIAFAAVAAGVAVLLE